MELNCTKEDGKQYPFRIHDSDGQNIAIGKTEKDAWENAAFSLYEILHELRIKITDAVSDT